MKQTTTVAAAQNHAEALAQTRDGLFRISGTLRMLGNMLAPVDCGDGTPLDSEDARALGKQLRTAAKEIGALIADTLDDAAGALEQYEAAQMTIQ